MENKCGECNLCCDIPEVKKIEKPAWSLCSNYDTKCKNCKIYELRPKECSGFQCAYIQMKKVNIALRPDKCGVMFERISINIFYGSLYSTDKLSMIAENQISMFNNQGFTVILSSPKWKEPKIFLNIHHNKKQIIKEIKEWQLQHTKQI